MEVFLKILTQLFKYLLRLYPRSYRNEFAEEMLRDFSDMAIDASKKGISSLIIFCWREFIDFPINLLRIYGSEAHMLKVLRLQPVNYGLRGAIGYSVGFASITLVGWWMSRFLFAALDPILQSYSIWYWETFQNERFIWLFNDFVTLLSYAFTGLLFGSLFALLAGDTQKRGRYLLAGSLAWFIPNVISNILSNSFGWSYYLSESQMNILGKLNLVLDGMFYSVALVLAESPHKGILRHFTIMVGAFPSFVYLYMKLVFYAWLEITRFFFPALILLLLIVIGGLFIIAVRDDKKIPWIILVGAVTYPILFDGVFRLIYSFPLSPIMNSGIPTHNIVDLTIHYAMTQASLGMCFGLLLGLVLGFQRKDNSSLLAT